MGRNRRQILKDMGAERQGSMPFFFPEQFTLITDKRKGMYDERVEDVLDPSFVKSIEEYGVLEAVKFRLNGKDAKGDWIREIVDGRQRVRACVVANKKRVAEGKDPWAIPSVQVYNEPGKDDSALFGKFTLMLNQQRMGNKPMYLARHALKLVEQGYSKADIGVFLKMTPQNVDNLLKLLHCSPKVQGLIQRGEAPTDLARKLAELPREEQDTAIDKMLAEIHAHGGSVKKGLKGSRGRKALEEATGKVVFAAPLGKKAILKEQDTILATIKAYKKDGVDADDPRMVEAHLVRNVIEFVLQTRKRRPWAIVEAHTEAAEEAKEEKPAKKKTKGSKAKKRARGAKRTQATREAPESEGVEEELEEVGDLPDTGEDEAPLSLENLDDEDDDKDIEDRLEAAAEA